MYGYQQKDWTREFCGVPLGQIKIGDFADGTKIAQCIQNKDPSFQLPYGETTDKAERVKNYEVIMEWVHANISVYAGFPPCTIPDAAEGKVTQSADGRTDSDVHAVLGLLKTLSIEPKNNKSSSSAPGAVAVPSGVDPEELQKLQLLFSSGFIQEEEYKQRLVEISGSSGVGSGSGAEHDSFTCACPTQRCACCYQEVKSCCSTDHQTNVCSKRSRQCPFCQEVSLGPGEFYEHTRACMYKSSRRPTLHETDHCDDCGASYSVFQKGDMPLSMPYYEGDKEEFGHWCSKRRAGCPTCHELTFSEPDHIKNCGEVYCFFCDTTLNSRAEYGQHIGAGYCKENVVAVKIMNHEFAG
eukprot:TRINITY_DN14150_c0_g1_i1.p1 TRINITY_DN14150_c0_g1~~TRINITY_DN14150_c0_g1_i1.p1  ORF type:complete len:365 (+),score=54.06 TRINITY_DN14150_c0_g1_i1:36-1097(+)